MRKIIKSTLPEPPKGPIRIYDRYDNFFRQKLRRAIRLDFEKFPDGLPTYYKNLIKITEAYASSIVNPDDLSLKDLENFIKGMNSHAKRIAILDSYVQIMYPELRPSFTTEGYVQKYGEVFSEYFESAALSGYDREVAIERLVGVYKLHKKTGIEHLWDKYHDRYFVIQRSSSNRYLLCYEFNKNTSMVVGGSQYENFRLVTGFCIPTTTASIIVMKDYKSQGRRIGKLGTVKLSPHDLSYRGDKFHLRVVCTFSNDDEDAWMGFYKDVYYFDFNKKLKENWATYLGERIEDKDQLKYFQNVVDNFEGVF